MNISLEPKSYDDTSIIKVSECRSIMEHTLAFICKNVPVDSFARQASFEKLLELKSWIEYSIQLDQLRREEEYEKQEIAAKEAYDNAVDKEFKKAT